MGGTLQNFARKYIIPIDTVGVDFDFYGKQAPPTKPDNGVYVHGLYLEGCRWNFETGMLDESLPKILFAPAPAMWFKPCVETEFVEYQHYDCPTYKTIDRRGVLATTGHSSNFVMMIRVPTTVEEKHWIKRGVA